MTHLRNILFALAAFIVFAPLPARAASVFIANVNPASFDVIAEFESPVRPDLLFGLDGRPLDNTAQLLTPDSPRKVHWFRARLQELPGTEFVNFAFSNSQETWSLLLPQTAAPPSAGPLVLNTNVRNALGGQMYVGSGIALVRLSKNGVKSAFSATFLTSDQQQLNISVSSLPSLYGSLDASGELMSGPDMRVRPGSRVELLVLSNARPTITFSALIHDPSGSDIQPSLPDLQFDLAPPDLDAPSSSNTKEATITWLRPPDTSGYELQRRGDADSEWTTIADISNPNTLQHTDQVAENGVYHYRARTVSTSPSAESAWSTPLTVNFAEAPVQVPSILQSYEVNSSNWTFSWPEVPGEDGVTYEYEIQWSRDPSFSDYSSLITSTPSATVPLAGQGTWYVRVRAILPGTPHLSGGWSTTATVTLALGTPELFVPLSTSSPSLFVNWSAVEPIPAGELLSYEVQLSDSSEFNNTLNGFTGNRTSTRLWLGNRGTWFLRVRALAGGNTGNWSQTAAVSFVPGDVSAPRELTAYPSTSEVRLHWTVSYPPDTYHTIYRAQEDGNFEVIGDLIQGDSFLDSTVSQFTKYSYRVVATDGNSEFESALVTTRTPAQTGFSGSVATSSAFSSGYAFLASASDSTDRIQLLRSPAAAQPSYSIALNDVANSANMTRSSKVRLVAHQPASLLIAYSSAGQLGLDELYAAILTVNASGGVSVSYGPVKLSSFYADIVNFELISNGTDGALVFYDALSGTYYSSLVQNGEYSPPVTLAYSDHFPSADFHRPVLHFDEDQSLHIACAADDGISQQILYGFMQFSASAGKYSEFNSQMPLQPLNGCSSLAGLAVSGMTARLAWTDPSGALREAQGTFTAGGLVWEESGTVLTDVLAAYGYGLLSDPAYIVLRSDRYVNKNVLSVARGSTENRALTPVETWSSVRDFGPTRSGDDFSAGLVRDDGKLVYIRGLFESPQSVTPGNGGGGGGGGCFVATAAFGAAANAAVSALCSVRDSTLFASSTGSGLIALYYGVSPSVSTVLTSSATARAVLRRLLAR